MSQELTQFNVTIFFIHAFVILILVGLLCGIEQSRVALLPPKEFVFMYNLNYSSTMNVLVYVLSGNCHCNSSMKNDTQLLCTETICYSNNYQYL